MIVVSNASPLIALARIGRLNLLASSYKRILISAEVNNEVTVAGRGLPGSEEVRSADWIEVAPLKSPVAPSLAQACQTLGAGERATILLAKSLQADLVLLDEWKARRVARDAGLSVVGCLWCTVERVERRTKLVVALGILFACLPCAFALDPSLDVSQYAHKTWKISEGFFQGSIRSLAQTPDGYLWVGTEFGLVRFDGVRAVPWELPAGEHLPNDDIRSLLGARDGRLWIGTFDGLASWKDGKLTHYRELDGQVIEGLLEDREGTIWVAGWAPSKGRLCSIRSGQTQCYGADGRFGSGVTPLFEDSRGDLWAGAVNGLWRWKPGLPRLYPMPDPTNRIYSLAESEDGGILVAKLSGITKFRDGKTEPYPLPADLPRKPYRLLKDRDGGLWIGDVVDRGLVHIHQGRTDLFSRSDGLSGSSVSSLLQDREGNIWVGTTDGLDRFRDFAVPTISVPQGLSTQGVFSILAAKDGSLWLGMSDGLNRWNQGRITVYHKHRVDNKRNGSPGLTAGSQPVRELVDGRLPDSSFECLFEDDRGRIWVGTPGSVGFLQSDRFVPIPSVPPGVVYSIAEDRAGDIWMSHQDAIFRLSQSTVVKRIPWAALGRA